MIVTQHINKNTAKVIYLHVYLLTSSIVGFCRFKLPAAEMTDFTARIPKS